MSSTGFRLRIGRAVAGSGYSSGGKPRNLSSIFYPALSTSLSPLLFLSTFLSHAVSLPLHFVDQRLLKKPTETIPLFWKNFGFLGVEKKGGRFSVTKRSERKEWWRSPLEESRGIGFGGLGI
ncbi:hypothetical protein NE237_007667 [Protea cynaroides]|uniref:Uncharacterized protein n=1 Tax=Protea cynaroides TaxID=273540 RepID=A0A9Q0KPJ6_9MAGN|nr:hypothetical protein NE237_007667 [Protea cynaroides]